MNSQNPFRKAISALLALALALSLAPVRAMAAGQEVPACGCESDDPSWHAPFCEAYVAPEAPQCQCVEKCAEGAANEWCDVCYFDAAACAASGEEEAAVYATAPNYIASIGIAQDGSTGNIGINDCKDELSGHTIIDRDLNDGAGGDYVYMGYKATTDPTKAITGIVFRVGGSPPDSITYNGYTFNLVGSSKESNTAKLGGYIDLNAKAEGDYIYMYVTRDPSYGAPLIDMTVDGSSSKSGYSTGTNTSGSVIDLNQKAGGDYIYLHYKQFSETVSATYHYLTSSGSRTSSTQSGTVKTHLEKMTKVPSYANSVTYDGRTFKFLGWRDDNTADAAEETSPFATYMTGTKTYRAVYQGNVTVSFDANGGTGAPSAVTGTQYINAGTSSVSKGNVSVTIPSGSCTHPTKCNLLGWSTGKTATSATYQPGGSITVSSNTTLYAVYGNHSYNDKGICTACSGLDHTCQYSTNGFCTRCDGYQPAVLGSGYYQITNGGNLFWFAKHINTVDRTANAKLTADINLEGRLWTPIGFTGETNHNFRGHFDGQGHTITGLNVEGGRSGLGFFGEVRLGTVENFTIYGEVKLIGKYDYVGGVIGSAPGVNENKPDHNGATIRNITSYVNVTLGAGSHGSNRVGGFIGYANHETVIENCAWYGTLDLDIYRAQDGVGGLLGKANDNSTVTIRNCGAYGTIRTAYKSGSYDNFDTIFIGGIVSNSVASAKTTIKNTLWAGKIVNETDLGTKAHIAAFGTLNGIDSVTDCYALDNAPYLTTNGTQDSYITSVTTEQLASGEVAYKLGAAWGQTIGSNAYPILGGKKVYCGYTDCQATEKSYDNAPLAENVGVHNYDKNGFCTVCDGFQSATGSGTKSNPYKIGNAGQLYWFAAEVNGSDTDVWAELTADIVVNENVLKADGTLNGDGSNFRPWTPIGIDFDWYTGTFDGNDKTVSGLYVNENTSFVGLFGWSEGTVKNVGVVDSYISGSEYAGGVVGKNNGTVEESYNTGNVSGGAYIGGVVGKNDGTVEESYNTGSICGSDDVISVNIGGVVGFNSGSVEDCYNTGAVSGFDKVGGVVGSSEDPVANCYNTGNVSGFDKVGGVVGANYGPVVNCYYDSDIYIGNAIGSGNGTATDVLGKSTADFASGMVAYLLSRGCTVGETVYSGDVWGQNLDGEGKTDAYPVFSDATVYQAKNCNGDAVGYSNTEGKQLDHTYDNGFCTVCGGFQNATGSGTKSNPYQIGNAGQLYWFAAKVNGGDTDAWAVLAADIVVNENVLKADGTLNGDGSNFLPWTPISRDYFSKYTGTFDGNDKTVSGLYVNENTDYVGLFGWSEGTVKNVGVVDSYLSGNYYVCGVVGDNYGTVANCYNTGNVSGGAYVGGVVGSNYDGTVEYCYNTGTVSGSVFGSDDVISVNIGGVVGFNSGSMEDCYNTGAVSGIDRVGGVVGSSEDPVANCYNTGNVSGDSAFVGGVAGSNYGPVVNCYYDSTVYSGNAIGFAYPTSTNNVEGKTAEQFKSGEVAYLLQGEQTQQVWGQNIDGTGDKDAYPVFSDAKVYPAKNCDGSDGIYSNTQDVQKDHIYENGFCTFCKGYQPATGDGTESDPYQIGNAGQLYWFAAAVNGGDPDAWAVLTANITVNTGDVAGCNGTKAEGWKDWTPIGKDIDTQYAGTFDGKGFTVSGLYFNDSDTDYVGLFGHSGGTVKNVGVVNSYLSGSGVGGVVGENYGTVESCYNTGTVSGSRYVGGVAGINNSGTVLNSYNTGAVSGSNYVGGVVGSSIGTVESCYNTGSVSGSNYVGGVVGENYGTVVNSHNIGSGSGSNYVGGVVGYNYYGTVVNCYYDSDIYIGTAISSDEGTSTDVRGKTTADFASGEVAYLLSRGCTVGETVYSGKIWGQNIDGDGEKDAYPVFSDAKVYPAKNCDGSDGVYSNTQDVQKDHIYSDNGFCTFCKGYQPATGDGTQEAPYKIGNAGQLYWFAAVVNDGYGGVEQNLAACAELTADITVNENVLAEDGSLNEGTFRPWTPVGNIGDRYTGTFDGKEFTVSGLYYNNSNTDYVGLFGYISGGTVQNVGVVDSYLSGSTTVGGLVGYHDGTVTNCYSIGTIVCKSYAAGGLVGYNNGTVENCYSSGSVSGSSSSHTGGLAGDNDGTLVGCYHTGSVSGTILVGGLAGDNDGTLVGCYHTGSISGEYRVGGVVYDNGGTVVNCYFDSTAYSGNAIVFDNGTATDVLGKTTEQFASGEVAYSLSRDCTLGEGETAVTYLGDVWGQNIDGEGEKDAYPVFSDAKVYAAKNCANEIAGYSNTDGKQLDHTYNDNGFCSLCGGYEPAELVNGYYEISNAGQLYWFAKQVNDGQSSINGELTANITVNENVLNADGTLNGDGSNFNPWTPIGSHYNEYTGTFDGDNHILSGLYFNDTRSGFLGLFGSIGDGNVKNVHVMNSYFGGTEYVGGIAGYSDAGTITNCYNSGTVSGTNCVGGVIGYSYGAVLTGCHSEGTISGNTNVGGVVGYNNYGSTVTDCSNTATINGKYNVGGVVGYGEESSAENCYNTGAVNGESYVGGVAGRNESGPIMCCYNTGTVNSNDYVGGVVGFNDYAGDVTNCYNTGAASGSGNNVGGVAGFNFTNITNCYYDSTVYSEVAIGSNRGAATNVEGKTSEEFASGHVAYLLSQGCTVGETVYSGDAWGQKLTGDDKDAYPVLSDAKVYQVLNCKLEVLGYSNSKQEGTPDHTYENGFCTVCGGFQPATGDGIESDPYKIGNAGQLYWFAAAVNDGDTDAWAVLTANITVNTGDVAGCNGTKAEGWKDWTPIGKDYDTRYAGTFDGKGFTVSGLYFNNSGVSYVGLFGFSNGTIKNVGVVNSYLHGFEYVCGVVSENYGTVEGCYNTGTVSGTGDHMIGGVVGKNSGTVEGCYNAGPVSGTGTGTKTGIGGVTGYNYGTVEGCYNAGPVSGSSKVGGVVGFNVNGTTVGCYNIGTVSGRYAVGGVVGDSTGGNRRSVVTNCYNTGAVSASGDSVGGVVGSNGGDISGCYNTGTVSGSSKVGGVVGYNGAGFTVINSYNNSDAFSGESIGLNDGTAVDVLNKTGAQFASGEVTYLLQGEQTQQIWGQNVDGEGEKDAYPIFSEIKVYPVSCCPGEYGGYSNTEGKQQAPKYNENGFCIYCGGYESAKGRGTEADPYQISNAGQLYWFAAVVNTGYGDVVLKENAWAELTANITVNEAVLKADGSLNDGTFQAWTPISGLEVRYLGTFDGNGFAVSGLYFHDTTAKYAGLFGVLEGDAVVRNVGVVDSYISGSQCIGAVVATNFGTVEGCYNAGTVIVGEASVGGVVGEQGRSMTNCYSTGAVSGNSNVGGVAGINSGTMTNCYNAGPVSGSGENIGGVAGFHVGSVTNCYYDSTVYSGEAFGNSYGTATKVEGKSTAEFASGAVTYSLSQGCTVGETTYSGDVWGQNIDGDDKDAYPLFSNAKVYFGYYDCLGSYTNNASVSQVKPGHSGQLTYTDNGDDATHTVTCDTCGDVVDASQIHSYGEDHKCLCGAVEEVLSVTISWGSMVFVYTEEAGWNNPDSAWVKTENTGNLQISVTYTYETDRTDIAGIFSDGTNSAAGTAVILPEQTYQVWLRLEGEPGEVLDNAVIGTVKVTVG